MKKNKVILIVRDGWGYREEEEKNFVKIARTANTDKLEKEFPTLHIGASEEWVGLPKGFFGNSEVGHMTLGAGRILLQSLKKINQSFESGEFFENENFQKILQKFKAGGNLHLMILMQKAGVHSHLNHLKNILRFLRMNDYDGGKIFLHLITDGRDSDIHSGIDFLKEILEINFGQVATLSGRYFAMDRNRNWDRTEKYYQTLLGQGPEKFSEPVGFLKAKYESGESDEFIAAAFQENFSGLQNNDSLIFLNFRKDRARQITKSLIEENFSEFSREKKEINFLSMMRYYKEQPGDVIFEDEKVENTLGEILEQAGKTQLRIAETEKFAHVTFFFDGGVKRDFSGKKEILIPSPDVATYDLKPEMSAYKITEKLISEINENKPDFILVNYANTDMVGHTGKFEAIKKAVEVVDECVGKIVEEGQKKGYSILLTADHGNVDDKREATLTTHTKNLVPLTIITDKENLSKINLKEIKGLADIKKIILKFMNLE